MILSGVITFVIGYLAILLLNKIKEKNFMTYFGVYRIALGVILIFLIALF
jgi:undecaprenyl pyrophosphate phosphatase UppP